MSKKKQRTGKAMLAAAVPAGVYCIWKAAMRKHSESGSADGGRAAEGRTGEEKKIFLNSYSVNEVYENSRIPLRENNQPSHKPARVLIVGAGSYIGTNMEQYLISHGDYEVHTLGSVNLVPVPDDFAGYDAVLHVAGIAHRKEKKENAHLYYEINRDLAVKTAEAVKAAGVPHFIILSSMSVYGMETGHITKNTKTAPKSHYGMSKLAADERIWQLRDEKFRVAILRPPIVYGNGCRGNYQPLRKMALMSPVFPRIDNERSMIYVGNLCEFVKEVISRQKEGIFFPQNAEYVNTSELVERIAVTNGKKVRGVKIFNPVIRAIHMGVFDKVFGSLTYGNEDSVTKTPFDDSIALTESRLV